MQFVSICFMYTTYIYYTTDFNLFYENQMYSSVFYAVLIPTAKYSYSTFHLNLFFPSYFSQLLVLYKNKLLFFGNRNSKVYSAHTIMIVLWNIFQKQHETANDSPFAFLYEFFMFSKAFSIINAWTYPYTLNGVDCRWYTKYIGFVFRVLILHFSASN